MVVVVSILRSKVLPELCVLPRNKVCKFMVLLSKYVLEKALHCGNGKFYWDI